MSSEIEWVVTRLEFVIAFVRPDSVVFVPYTIIELAGSLEVQVIIASPKTFVIETLLKDGGTRSAMAVAVRVTFAEASK